MAIGIFQKGILKSVPYLSSFLDNQEIIYNPANNIDITAIAGWGYRPTSYKARQKAKEWGVPYIALEDGFIRSFNLGFESSPLSIVVDNNGIYYDANSNSDLEKILLNDWYLTIEQKKSAELLKNVLISNNISKYNNYSEENVPLLQQNDKEKILLIEQTYQDMSVSGGLADEKTFKDMYTASLDENPKAYIYIKTHPDIIKGNKKGYLTRFIKQYNNVYIIKENVNPILILKQVDKVYTVTSQLGFEALLLNKPVVCFGVPFYSNWGITDDRINIKHKRYKQRNLYEIFFAAYFIYAKYIKPDIKTKGIVWDVVNHIILLKNRNIVRTPIIKKIEEERGKENGRFYQIRKKIFFC